MSSFKTYNAGDVSIVLGAILIDGYADGEFVSVAQDENTFDLYVGSKGESTRSLSNNRSATITFTVQQTADCNDLLTALHELDRTTNKGAVPLVIRDNSGRQVYAASKAWIEKPPQAAFGRETGTRQWTIRTHELIAYYGGN